MPRTVKRAVCSVGVRITIWSPTCSLRPLAQVSLSTASRGERLDSTLGEPCFHSRLSTWLTVRGSTADTLRLWCLGLRRVPAESHSDDVVCTPGTRWAACVDTAGIGE